MRPFQETHILKLIKIIPVLGVIFIASLLTYVIINDNIKTSENEFNIIKKKFSLEQKQAVKQEVLKVYEQIQYEKQQLRSLLKKSLKQRVYEAHAIATKIYEENKQKDKTLIKKMIQDALVNIRFNEGRGYFYIYSLDYECVLLPIARQLEGSSFYNFQEGQGRYLTREIIQLVKQEQEGFLTWHYFKPQDKNKQYEKLGFNKYFEPLDWFIGTGEYLVDFEAMMQKRLLERIQNTTYGTDGYIFILDKKGSTLTHKYREFIGKDLTKRFPYLSEVLKIASQGEGYLHYEHPTLYQEKKKRYKISFVKGEESWGWSIGAGFFTDSLDNFFLEKQTELQNLRQSQIIKIIILNSAITFVVIVLSLLFSKEIKRRFTKYHLEVEHASQKLAKSNQKLEELNKALEQKVAVKVEEIRHKDQVLQHQAKHAAMGEMIGAIAHQWRQPLNVLNIHIENLEDDFEEGLINEEFIQQFIQEQTQTIRFMSNTIDDFRNFFRIDKAKTIFDAKTTIKETIKLLQAQLKSYNIKLSCEGESFLVNGFRSEFQQVILNILNNAKDAISTTKTLQGQIHVYLKKGRIEIYDNAGGIPQKVLSRIFEPYFTTKEQGKGTGMGLYLAKMIIEENMHGKLHANNNKNGAMFIIEMEVYDDSKKEYFNSLR